MAVSKSMESNNLPLISSGTWDTEFLRWSEIELNPNEESYNIPISSDYYCIGELIFFNIHVLITNPISWTLREKDDDLSNWRFKLPFKKIDDWNINPSSTDNFFSINSYSTNLFTGRYVGRSKLNIDKITKEAVTPMFGIISFDEYLYLYGLDSKSDYTKTYAFKNITSKWPIDFISCNSNYSNEDSKYLRLSISGIYRGEIK